MSTFSKNLSFLSEKYGISNNRIAQSLNVSQSTISRAISEKSKPRAALVADIAKFFNLTSWDLEQTDLRERPDRLNCVTIDAPARRPSERTLLKKSIEEALVKIQSLVEDDRLLENLKKFGLTATGICPEGAFTTVCETDDLLPQIARGSLLYVKPMSTEEAIKSNTGSKVIGKFMDKQTGKMRPALGELIVSQGAAFVKSSNPAFNIPPIRIEDVIGKIVGWSYFER